jgi:transcriptional regulator with XRE-family HTH domain
MDNRTKIASMLVAYRYAKKQSQMKVANKLQVTFQQVQKYEKNINGLSADKLLLFCDAYQIPLASFQFGDAYQILDGADIEISKKEKAMILIDKLEVKYNDKSRSNENMVGKSFSPRSYL